MCPDGSRLIQAFLKGPTDVVAPRVAELRGHVPQLLASPHGNYVLSAVVEILPNDCSTFIATELLPIVAEAACHPFGCRIWTRLVDHSHTQPATSELIQALLEDETRVLGLMLHKFAHHIIRSIVVQCPGHRPGIAATIVRHTRQVATDRHGAWVIEDALAHCETEAADAIARALFQEGADIAALLQDPSACFVAKMIATTPRTTAQAQMASAIALEVHRMYGQLRETRGGQQLVEALMSPDYSES